MKTAPTGERFSQIYLDRGSPTRDSVRFRRRLAQQFDSLVGGNEKASEFGKFLVSRAGTEVRHSVTGTYHPKEVFLSGELRDMLDAITLFHEHLARSYAAALHVQQLISHRGLTKPSTPHPKLWLDFVAAAMREENIGYRVDEGCGVHFYVDEQFERNRSATLDVLSSPLLVAARASYEDAFRHLDSDPRDSKAAVRSMFESLEIVAKQIVPGAPRLNRELIDKKLKEACLFVASSDATEQRVLGNMFDSLVDWVTGLHSYRHGQASDEPVAPSEELAVYVLSTGSAYVRQLALWFLRMPQR
jgi:hypothetical protein